jgi:hypothetical protein
VIAALLLGVMVVATPVKTPVPVHELPPEVVLLRYAEALSALKAPKAVSFDYTLEQTGRRARVETHRIFRTGLDERDEILSSEGRPLTVPIIRIFRGRRDRYTVAALAPRLEQYDFTYAGPHRDGRHIDYVFRLDAKKAGAFTATEVVIDGVKFLPHVVRFTTSANHGSGSVSFDGRERWWVAVAASARATFEGGVSTERLAFSAYRFPTSLPPSTFAIPRPLPTVKP